MLNTQHPEYSSLVKEKRSWGRKLLIAAWIVEIIAAFIGLMVAWSMGYQTYELYSKEFGVFPTSKVFDLVLAALPFIMVAAVELLKIPICYLVYINRSFRIQVVYALVLALLTFITFETLITGFERQYSNISTQVKIPLSKLTVVEKNIAYIEKEIAKLKNTSIESINKQATLLRDDAEKSLNDDLSNLRDRKTQYLQSGNETLLSQIKSFEKDIEILIGRRDSEIEKIEKANSSFVREEIANQKILREENNKQIKALRQEIAALERKIAQRESEGLGSDFWKQDIPKWEKRVAAKEKLILELSSANAKTTVNTSQSLKQEISKIWNAYEKDIKKKYDDISLIEKEISRNNKYQEEIDEINKLIQKRQEKYSEELAKIDSFRLTEEDKLTMKNTEIAKLEKEVRPYKKEQVELDAEVILAYEATQIYRIAKSFYGVEPGVRITEKQISFVAKVWFGSLAGVVSSMGVFLAFGAFILKHTGNEFKELRRRSGPVRKSLRAKNRYQNKRGSERGG